MDTVSKLSRYAAQTNSDIRVIGRPRPLTMTWYTQTIPPDSEVLPAMWLLRYGKSPQMLMCMKQNP